MQFELSFMYLGRYKGTLNVNGGSWGILTYQLTPPGDGKFSFQGAIRRLKALYHAAQGKALGKMNGIIPDAP
jgi:hypothetical protein